MTKRKTNIFYFLLKINVIAVVSTLQLDTLDYRDILDASHERCLVTVPAEELVDESTLSVISSAANAFKNEPRVSFHRVDFDLSDAAGFQSDTTLENSFLVFKLLRKDRTCLLAPRRTIDNLKPDVYAFRRDTDYIVDHVVEFINKKCLTFRKSNGNLTPQGLHEEYILSNLFSVSDTDSSNSNSDSGDLNEVSDGTYCATNSNNVEKNIDCLSAVIGSESKYNSANSQPKITRHCERISLTLPTSSSEFLNEYVTMSKPVIITDAIAHWPVFKRWKNEFLKEKYGDTKVHIKITPNGEYEGVESTVLWENKSKVKIPQDVFDQLPFPDLVVVRPATMEIEFSEFVDLIESIASSKSSNISAYLEYSSISYFPGLEKDISEMSFIDGVLDLKHTNVWLSDGNTVGKLHFDPFDNFMCQISGEKEFILYDPHDNQRLYEAHIQESKLSYNSSTKQFSRQKLMESTSMVMSPVDIEKPDLKRFPQFVKAQPMSCKIQPGEVLFTPAFWWHEVRSRPNETEHRNLAVNFWYEPFFLKEFPCPECSLYVNPKYFHLL